MSKFKITPIRYKLITGIVTIFILVTIVYFLYFISLYRNLLKNEEEKINIYNKSVSININKDIMNLINEIKSILALDYFKKFNITKMIDISNYQKKNNPFINTVIICDDTGDIIFISDENILTSADNLSEYDFYNIPFYENNIVFSDNYSNNSLFITISAPIIDNNDNSMGVIIYILNIENKNLDLFNNIVDPDSYDWQIILTNKKGILLYHTHKKITNESIKNLDYSKYPSVKNALLGNWELSRVNINGQSWYTSSEFITTCNWYVITQVPRAVIVNKVFNILMPNIILIIIITIASIIITLIWANMFITPLINLTNAIREYGEKGNTKILKEKKGKDEISQALKSFNKMINERKKLEREVFEVIERERKKIGKEIHNDLENIISNIYHQVLILEEELNKILNKENLYIVKHMGKISKLLNEVLNKTKSISNGLCPVTLQEGGLINTIKELIKNYQSVNNVKYQFKYDDDIIIKDEIVAINIFYILNEAIDNAIKYNNADNISISFIKNEDNITLEIIDNGSPFEEEKNIMGIRIMNYNARLINADLLIENLKNGGNKTTCIIYFLYKL